MIQDIAPHIFSNAYAPKRPEATSYALYFDGHMVLASKASATLRFPRFAELNGIEESIYEKAIYLPLTTTVFIWYIKSRKDNRNSS